MKKLSVIVPFYNESANVRIVLDSFSKFYPKYDFELICVNDGSKDPTADIFKKLESDQFYPFAKLISYSPNGGYGNAILTGVRLAEGEVICWTHSDMQTDPADVFKAFDLYETNPDPMTIIKGKRKNRALPQVILSLGMSVLASAVLEMRLIEINAQPKLFHRSFMKHLEDAPRDFSLDLYLLCIAKRNGYRILPIDVLFKDRIHGESSWGGSLSNRIKTIKRTVLYIFKLRT